MFFSKEQRENKGKHGCGKKHRCRKTGDPKERNPIRPEPEPHQRTPSWLLPSGPDQVHGPAVTRTPEFKGKCGGEGGIRTLGTRKRTHAFQACSLSHSDTSPSQSYEQNPERIPNRHIVSPFLKKLPTDHPRNPVEKNLFIEPRGIL